MDHTREQNINTPSKVRFQPIDSEDFGIPSNMGELTRKFLSEFSAATDSAASNSVQACDYGHLHAREYWDDK
jgi:hypothetical protein